MKTPRFISQSPFGPRGLLALALLSLSSGLPSLHAAAAPVVAKPSATVPVSITENATTWTLDNGIVRAVILKRSGNLSSLIYQGRETMGNGTARASGIWEEDPSAAATVGGLTDTLTIDPAKNDGARAEVAVKGVTGGQVALTVGSPGSTNGTSNIDLEIRYTLGRGESGIYTYAVFSHPAAYGAANIGESRFIIEMNRDYNWISVDADRNMLECAPTDWGTGVVVHAKEQRIMNVGVYQNSVEHKYSYNAVQYQVPAYGWSSTKNHDGIWLINPTIEYLSGGATKQELDCHFGDNGDPTPIILDYWRGTHYGGGATCSIAAGETWSKVIGPILIYVNNLSNFQTPSAADLATLAKTAGNPAVPPAWKDNATALWQDALAQAKTEKAHWPYDWVNGVDYPHQNERGTVTGQLVINDPLSPSPVTKLPHLIVGLAYPDAAAGASGARGGRGGRGGGGGGSDWVHDAKHYQFWNDGTEDGKFTLTAVRPGNYTLHAIADGVLGDYARASVTVVAGQNLDLGKLDWKPVRYGQQLWDIGYPDRTGGKFFKGDGANYWLWGWNLRYALLFPNDLTYTIGQSDFHKDWFFEEVPHATNLSFVNPAAPDPANQRFGWVKGETLAQYPQTNTRGPWAVYGTGRATTWTIKFNRDQSATGTATFRVALAGADGNGGLTVAVNGQSIGTINPTATNAIRYNTDKAVWQERDLTFDAALMKAGANVMTLTVPGGDLQSGVVYDYLRLELDASRPFAASGDEAATPPPQLASLGSAGAPPAP